MRVMIRISMLVVALIGCKDSSGTAHEVAPAPKAKDNAPEPAGGPPSCSDVGAHLAAALEVPEQVHAKTGGADIAVSGEMMRDTIEHGIAQACRTSAWTLDTRKCALTWQGNILRERAKLGEACPGTQR